MELSFSKWHGTGNDFILVDDRMAIFPAHDLQLVQRLCDRHLGIGSDGLILIQPPRDHSLHFHMEFFNPDGSRSFCGNGSRCAYAFWSRISGDGRPARFSAVDGIHDGRWEHEKVSVGLRAVDQVVQEQEDVDHIHTGSPHELVWVEDPDQVDLPLEGSRRRHDPRRGAGGTNVNFVKVENGAVLMRTFERGVEAETLSCGTGVVAAALSALARNKVKAPVPVITRGGRLDVEAVADANGGWQDIRLLGPAVQIYNGTITI